MNNKTNTKDRISPKLGANHLRLDELKIAQDRVNEDKFKLAFEHAVDAILWANPETGLIINCNKAAENLFDIPRTKLIGSHQTTIHPPSKKEQGSQIFRRHIKNKQTIDEEMEIVTGTGIVKTVHVTASLADISDKPLLQGIFRDVSDRKKLEKEILYKSELGHLIAEIATSFVNISMAHLDNEIIGALSKLCLFMNIDRGYVFLSSQNKSILSKTHEWVADGIEAKIKDFQNMKVADFPWLVQKILNKDIVHIPRVGELPTEAKAEIKKFISTGNKSLILIPLIYESDVFGFMGFDSILKEKTWDPYTISSISVVSEVFASAITRKIVEEDLRNRTEIDRLIIDIAPKFVNVLSFDISQLINEALADIGKLTAVDYSFLCHYSGDKKIIKGTYFWSRGKGIDANQNSIGHELSKLVWNTTRMQSQVIINIPNVAHMPENSNLKQEQFKSTGIHSPLCVPFNIENHDYGFIGLALNKRPGEWSDNIISLLQISGEIFGSALRQKMISEELNKEKYLFNTLMDNIPDNIYFKDKASRFIRINKAHADEFGLAKPEEAFGKTDFDFFTKEHSDKTYRDEQNIIETGRPVLGIEEKETWPDGSITWVSTTKMPLYDNKGEIIGTFGISRDITERKQSNLALEEARRLITALMENIPDYIYFKDEKSRFIKINKSLANKFCLKNPDDAIGKTDADFFSKQDAERMFSGEQSMMKTGLSILSHEAKKIWPDGSEIWTSTIKMPLYNDTGIIVGTFGISRDITAGKKTEEEHQQMKERMQHSQKMESLGVLSGGIAHDFNNFLVGIMGNAGLALMDLPSDSYGRSHVKEIETIALRATELTNQLLAYSGESKIVKKPVNLSQLVKEMANLLKVSISEKAKIEYIFTEDLPSVEVDPAQIRQVVMNLITNASDAIGAKRGVIRLSTGLIECDNKYFMNCYFMDNQPAGRYVFLEVSDTGCGMDHETISKIFEPFFTTKVTGRGLGLSAVLGIVRSHKGALKVGSKKGVGTTFTILFPASDLKAEDIETAASSSEIWTTSGTVLIIDDDDIVCTVTQRMLERMGLSVLIAKDGKGAVRQFKISAKKLDGVLLDMTMPDIAGEDVLKMIKRIRKSVPVILMSGYNEKNIAGHLPKGSYEGFLQKPYNIESLSQKIKGIINGKGSK